MLDMSENGSGCAERGAGLGACTCPRALLGGPLYL